MPQFSPLWFINLISWSYVMIIFLVYFNQSVNFPIILKRKLTRLLLLFHF